MKKMLFPIILAIAVCTSGQAQSEQDLKLAISTVAQSYIGWHKGSCFYFTAGDYFTDKNSGQIIGQKFTNPLQSEFSQFKLVKENGQFTKARLDDNHTFLLTWQDNRIKHVKGQHLHQYDYNISYNASGKIEKMNGANGEEITFTYDGDQLQGITAMGMNKGKPFPISVGELLENNEKGFKMRSKMYTRGKPMKDKHIRGEFNCSCQKVGDKQYKSVTVYKDVVEQTYDDKERLIKKIISKTNRKQQIETYSYKVDGEVSRKEVITKEGGIFKGKEIKIFAIPENTSGLEKWELKKGTFRFDEKDELVYEAIDRKYREKKDGVWSAWKSFQY